MQQFKDRKASKIRCMWGLTFLIKVAVVDDEPQAIAALEDCLRRYGAERKIAFDISSFGEEQVFLSAYTADYQIVFLDIELRCQNGIRVAQRLREMDRSVILIFVTNLRQYAIEGYYVEAYGYMVKPIKYPEFETLLSRALKKIAHNESGRTVVLTTRSFTQKVPVENIRYVEAWGHETIYHLEDGAVTIWESLKTAESRLAGYDFARCNACYLVNLAHVTGVKGFTVYLSKGELAISHPRKKQFMQALAGYLER